MDREKIVSLFLVFFCCASFLRTVSHAGVLLLPDPAKSITYQISVQCDNCLEKGFFPSGTDGIGFGKAFFPNFFLGSPEVGMLVSHDIAENHYERVLRDSDYTNAKMTLLRRFQRTKLIVIERKGYRVHISHKPKEVTVVLRKELHQCLYRTSNLLCCCCTANCETECCEKKLGSTYVLIRWEDPLNAEQSIEYGYYPHAGYSRIVTIEESGKRRDLRWCLDSAGPGFLK